MGFTNSSLVTYTRISPNRTSPRNQPITKITVHHTAGVLSVEGFGNIVASPSREMSANYAIGNDGRIGLFCEEKDRSWCSSSAWNDNRAITIEVSNSADGGDWPIGDKAYKSLIKLCVDICKRNGIPKLTFTGDRNGSLTFHYMYASTACPGPWMKAHVQDLCNKVNAQLGAGSNEKKDDNGFKSYTVRLKTTDPVFDSAGGKKIDTVGPGNVFTIVDDKTIGYIKYGKLKSGKGWVIVEDKTPAKDDAKSSTTIKKGDLVKINSGARYYTGGAIPQWVLNEKWYIDSISGSRAVLGRNESGSRNIQSPIDVKNLTKVSASANNEIVKGSLVKVLNPIVYGTNRRFVVYASKYYVLEVSGNRVVISADNKNVTAAIDKKNLQKIG